MNARWPRLGDFPMTNALGVAVISGWAATGATAILFAVISTAFGVRPLMVPVEWWDALKWFSGYAFAQFSMKRLSHKESTNAVQR